jgi:hypothetical protein
LLYTTYKGQLRRDRLKVKNIEITYVVDHQNNIVHVLEENQDDFCRLFNFISPEFQNELLTKENLSPELADYNWFCYALNGSILAYKDFGLTLVCYDEKTLHKPFLRLSDGW